MQVKSSPANLRRKIIYDLLVVDSSLSVGQLSEQSLLSHNEVRASLEFFRYHKVIGAEKKQGSNGRFAGSLRTIDDVFVVI